MHKEGFPCRPIVSAVNTFNYNVGKFLVWILTPYMPLCDSFVRNSTNFVQKVANLKPGYSLQVSFDVKSLYTNVPVKEAIEVALSLVQNDNET